MGGPLMHISTWRAKPMSSARGSEKRTARKGEVTPVFLRPSITSLVVLVVLAGCTSSDDRPEDAAGAAAPLGLLPDGSPVPTSFDLTSCAMPLGVLPIPDAAVEPLLPEDFELAPFPGDQTDETATLIAAVKSCDPFEGEPMREFVALVAVTPPAVYAGDHTSHFILLSWVTTNPTVAAIGKAWGAGSAVTLGVVEMDHVDGLNVGVSAKGMATHGNDRYELHVSAGGEPTFNPARLRAFVVDEREVVAIIEEDHDITQLASGSAALRAEGTGLAGLSGPVSSGLGLYVLPEGDVEHFRYVPLPEGTGDNTTAAG